jgi:2,4-dienoyl-CoA reductase-like NADH-dependent reductase (Old Yellow Enzyme family)
MALLNQSLTIKSVTLKNRLGMPPMCQYSAENGFLNNWHYVHYGARAVGGLGLIIVEATAIAPEGRITPFDLGLWNDEQIPGLKKITEFIHSQDSVAAIQIGHAGRKASHDSPDKGGKQLTTEDGGWETVAPSAIPFNPSEIPPISLNQSEIETVICQFKDTALRAHKAGFKVLEIHAAHGYLIHQFLSPLSNQRTDKYGGSFENRIRLLLEITDAIQTVWPVDLPLLVRLSATDWTEGGWNVEETVELCRILKDMGVDLIDCSSGGNIATAKIPVAPGYQIQFSESIRKTGILTAAVGLITTVEQIAEILDKDQADIVLLGRELLRNPYFALTATCKTVTEIEWPVQYLRSK